MQPQQHWFDKVDEVVRIGVDEGVIRPPLKFDAIGPHPRFKSELATSDILDDDRADRI